MQNKSKKGISLVMAIIILGVGICIIPEKLFHKKISQDKNTVLDNNFAVEDHKNDLKLTSPDNGKTLNVANGQTIEITLANPGDGGYQFNTPDYDNSIIKLISTTSIPYVSASGTPIRVGNFGTVVFKFQTLNVGQSKINITASRSWEKSGNGVSIFSSTIVVQ